MAAATAHHLIITLIVLGFSSFFQQFSLYVAPDGKGPYHDAEKKDRGDHSGSFIAFSIPFHTFAIRSGPSRASFSAFCSISHRLNNNNFPCKILISSFSASFLISSARLFISLSRLYFSNASGFLSPIIPSNIAPNNSPDAFFSGRQSRPSINNLKSFSVNSRDLIFIFFYFVAKPRSVLRWPGGEMKPSVCYLLFTNT